MIMSCVVMYYGFILCMLNRHKCFKDGCMINSQGTLHDPKESVMKRFSFKIRNEYNTINLKPIDFYCNGFHFYCNGC